MVYHDCGTENPHPLGIRPAIQPIRLRMLCCQATGEHEGDRPATVTFYISWRWAWIRIALVTMCNRSYHGDPRRRISGRSQWLDRRHGLRDVAGRFGHGSERHCALDRISYAGCECTCGARRCWGGPFVVSPAGLKSLYCPVACDAGCLRLCCDRLPRARERFGGPAFVRASGNHNSAYAKTTAIVIVCLTAE